MLRFFGKLLLFALAVSAVYAFPLYVYWKGKEFASIEQIIKAQQSSQPVIFGFAYDYVTPAYKTALVDAEADRVQVLILGASRVQAFRSTFFKQPSLVVNAANAVNEPGDFVPFMEQLPTHTSIKIIIMEMQEIYFEPGYVSQEADEPQQISLSSKLNTFFSGNFREPYIDYFAGKFSQARVGKFTVSQLAYQSDHTPNIGMTALIRQTGFLNDGSFYEGYYIHQPNREAVLNASVVATVAELQQDRGSFRYGTSTDPESIKQVEAFLALCKARGIYVIGEMPPYSPSIRTALASKNDAYSAEMYALPKQLSAVFAQYGYPLFDYTDAARIGITDEEFLDTYHPSDKADLRILIDMAEHDPVLRTYVDLPTLQTLLANSKGDFVQINP